MKKRDYPVGYVRKPLEHYGECVLERWCEENGMASHGNIYTPNYLPEGVQQYIRDICLKYCMSEKCPK